MKKKKNKIRSDDTDACRYRETDFLLEESTVVSRRGTI